MDNKGPKGSLDVPGFGDTDLDYELRSPDRFAHGINEWEQVPAITARELAMIALMNEFTDKPGWHVEVFNEQFISSWRREVFASSPLISQKAFAWCVAELRDKAGDFRRNHYIRVLDTGSCICKSDSVPGSLISEFKSGVAPLLRQQQLDRRVQQRHGHPDDSQVTNIVDPSLYPLVYGRSLVLVNGRQVDLDIAQASYTNTELAPSPPDRRVESEAIQEYTSRTNPKTWSRDVFDAVKSPRQYTEFPKEPDYFWSFRFQWLPSEVEFVGCLGSTDVQITSYINNLDPKHRKLYQSLEKLISLAIKPWNDCLIKGRETWAQAGSTRHGDKRQRGPVPARIITYGIEWEIVLPEWGPAFNQSLRTKIDRYHKAMATHDKSSGASSHERRKARTIIQDFKTRKLQETRPDLTPDLWEKAKAYLQLPPPGSSGEPVVLPPDWKKRVWGLMMDKHKAQLRFKHPEPGSAFSYQDWKSGSHGGRAVVDVFDRQAASRRTSAYRRRRRTSNSANKVDRSPSGSDHTPYTIQLENSFRKEGLQVIIQIGGIELTPASPSYDCDTWQLGGRMMNEHVVATALYAYDVSNVTERRLRFRQYTDLDESYYSYDAITYEEGFNKYDPPAHGYGTIGGDAVAAMAAVLGLTAEELYRPRRPAPDPLPDQEIGSVALPQGRMVTFPNGLAYRNEPMELLDPTAPGHHRYIALHLVDPHYGICSTRNVPPQRLDWWAASVNKLLGMKGLPQEIADLIIGQCGDWLISGTEAAKYAREMQNECNWMNLARYCSKPAHGFR